MSWSVGSDRNPRSGLVLWTVVLIPMALHLGHKLSVFKCLTIHVLQKECKHSMTVVASIRYPQQMRHEMNSFKSTHLVRPDDDDDDLFEHKDVDPVTCTIINSLSEMWYVSEKKVEIHKEFIVRFEWLLFVATDSRLNGLKVQRSRIRVPGVDRSLTSCHEETSSCFHSIHSLLQTRVT